MKRLVILGCTGSIGRQTLDVASRLPERLEVAVLAARSNVNLMEKQIRQFRPDFAVMTDEKAACELRRRLGPGFEVRTGEQSLLEAAAYSNADMLVSAVVGAAGLLPTVAAIESGKDIALANKETLVTAGGIVTGLARKHGVMLLPVDSEHSAVFQCLEKGSPSEIREIILTASGGPFRQTPVERLRDVTVEEALAHPTWRMGGKITIDSATLMNKGLEVIEAHWLFGVPGDRIRVVVHPESIIHSMVEFVDHSVIAQLGLPDMRVPIQYALTYPDRMASPVETLDLTSIGRLTFEAPDFGKFPCLKLAYEALQAGGTAPAALNAANEVAVSLFLEGRIGFCRIPEIVSEVLSRHTHSSCPTLEEILDCDRESRELALRTALNAV